MKEDLIPFAMLGFMLVIVVLLFGMLFYSGQQFAEQCERSGGTLVKYDVCLPAAKP